MEGCLCPHLVSHAPAALPRFEAASRSAMRARQGPLGVGRGWEGRVGRSGRGAVAPPRVQDRPSPALPAAAAEWRTGGPALGSLPVRRSVSSHLLARPCPPRAHPVPTPYPPPAHPSRPAQAPTPTPTFSKTLTRLGCSGCSPGWGGVACLPWRQAGFFELRNGFDMYALLRPRNFKRKGR